MLPGARKQVVKAVQGYAGRVTANNWQNGHKNFKSMIEESSHNVYINKSKYNISALFLTEVLFGDSHFFELILVINLSACPFPHRICHYTF